MLLEPIAVFPLPKSSSDEEVPRRSDATQQPCIEWLVKDLKSGKEIGQANWFLNHVMTLTFSAVLLLNCTGIPST